MTDADNPLDETQRITMAATVPGIRLVGIDGPAGSGKSTIADQLSRAFEWPVIRIDDFFSWVSFTNWWPRFASDVIAPLLEGRDARYRVRDWAGDEFGGGLAGWKEVAWAPVVIIEGVGATRSEIADVLACRVWVDATAADRLQRGVTRDGESHRQLWIEYMPRENDFFAADEAAHRADVRINTSERSHPARP